MRADSFARRLVGALARTGFEAPLASGRGVTRDSRIGWLISALARTAPDESLDRHAPIAESQPKQRKRGRATAPLRELGDDPVSGKKVVVKEGRFGPYVTDGETNASLRRGDDVELITLQRAAELLAQRREKVAAGARKKTTRRA